MESICADVVHLFYGMRKSVILISMEKFVLQVQKAPHGGDTRMTVSFQFDI
jgi:hypothetical protein